MLIQDLGIDHRRALSAEIAGRDAFVELFVEMSAIAYVAYEEERLAGASIGTDSGVGVRVVHQGRTGYAWGNRLTTAAVVRLAVAAGSTMRGANPWRSGLLGGEPPELRPAPQRSPLSALSAPELSKIVALCRRAERAAYDIDARIRQVRIGFLQSDRHYGVANSLGDIGDGRRALVQMICTAIASKDEERLTGYAVAGGPGGLAFFERTSPEQIGGAAARRAAINLDAEPAPAGQMPVVLAAEAGGAMIHEAVGHGLEGDTVNAGASCYAGRLGQLVASPLITLVDDPTREGLRGVYTIDDEGVPATPTTLIDRGRLESFLHHRLSAEQAQVCSTGNGRRESFRFPPLVRMSNLYVVPGKTAPESVVGSTERGLLVRQFGGGEVDTVSGDFVFEASEAYLIEKGKISAPVRGATLSGNGPAALVAVDAVGCDLGFDVGVCSKRAQSVPVSNGQPTIRVPRLLVGSGS